MSGVDDELTVDFASEDSAIGTEPDSPVAADFKSKQPFATNKARDAGPAKSEIDARLAGEEGSRLKVEGRPFQLDALDVAAGRLDAFWEIGLAPWDIAAGALLVREAGGLVADIDSSENFLESGNVVAGSPKCFKAVLQTVKPLLR